MATSAINFSSQRISFVNKIGMILKATSDDEQPTQGYLYKEINEISFESVGYSESLVEFLVDRLKNKSCHVKFKVLKVMKHIVDNGSREFVLGLRKHSDKVKECTKFGGPPHPIHGNVPYTMVRKIATEVCESLYKTSHFDTNSEYNERQQESKYGGMGPVSPVRSGGTIQGFGNTPTQHNKGLGETILDELERLSNKMSETPSDRQAALLAKLDLSGSVSNYQPPVVTCEEVPTKVVSPTTSDVTHNVLTTSIKRPVKKHQQGKAGGGWSDDEDDDNGNDDKGNLIGSDSQLSFETDSLADPSLRIAPEEPTDHWSAETDLVTTSVNQGSTGPHRALLTPSELRSFQIKATKLNCKRVVEDISHKLTSQKPGIILRCLQLLETITYNSEELVGLEDLTSTCKHALVTCYSQCDQHLLADNVTESSPQGSPGLWSMVKVKCAKIILTLQGLTSQKDILPSSKFQEFLPVYKPSTEAVS